MNTAILKYKYFIYIFLFVLLLCPLTGIMDVKQVASTYGALDYGFPYGVLANRFFSFLAVFYLIFIVLSVLNPTYKKQFALIFPSWIIDVSLLKGYYIAVAVTLLYVVISLPIVEPLGCDLLRVVAIGAGVALFFLLLLVSFLLLFRRVLDRYVGIKAQKNQKETCKMLGILFVGLAIIFVITRLPGYIYNLCPEQSLPIFIGLSLFALIFHYPIIKSGEK